MIRGQAKAIINRIFFILFEVNSKILEGNGHCPAPSLTLALISSQKKTMKMSKERKGEWIAMVLFFSILKWLHIFLGAFIFDSSVLCCFKENLRFDVFL